MKSIKTLLTAIAVMVMTTACNDSENSDPNSSTLFNSLVTYDMTMSDEKGDVLKDIAYFTFYTDDNRSNPISYFSTGMTKKIDAEPGSRMIIAYYLAGGQAFGQSGQISLVTYRTVPGGTVEIKPTAEAEAANAPMQIVWINRTGNYINLTARLMNNPDRTFTMIADQATVGQSIVDMYVTTATPSTGDTGIIGEATASFNMESIWRNANTEKVRIHINNTVGTNVYEFTK